MDIRDLFKEVLDRQTAEFQWEGNNIIFIAPSLVISKEDFITELRKYFLEDYYLCSSMTQDGFELKVHYAEDSVKTLIHEKEQTELQCFINAGIKLLKKEE